MSDAKNPRQLLTKARVLDAVSFVARFYMAYIWLKAGLAKIDDRVTTAQSIKGYDIFSDAWVQGLSHIIAPLEIMGGVLLLTGLFLRYSSILSTVVLSLFIIGIAQAWARGIVTDCGCFGAEPTAETGMNYAKTIGRDLIYVFLSMWTVYRPFRRFALYA